MINMDALKLKNQKFFDIIEYEFTDQLQRFLEKIITRIYTES